MIYKMKDAARFRPGFDRDAGAARLAQLLERDGSLEIEAIIQDGVLPDSPLHPQFTMDPDEALRATWEREAAYLQRSFVVVIDTGGAPREVRAVVPVFTRLDADNRRYIPTVVALSDADYRSQVLQQALTDLLALRRKYADLEELARIFKAIDATAKRMAA